MFARSIDFLNRVAVLDVSEERRFVQIELDAKHVKLIVSDCSVNMIFYTSYVLDTCT